MEHWCGQLLPAIKSCVYPYKSLTRQQLAIAQENLILVQYNLFDAVHGPAIDPDDPQHREEVLSDGMYTTFVSTHQLADWVLHSTCIHPLKPMQEELHP